MRYSYNTKRKGFSLIEILIAMTILSLAFFPLIRVFTKSYQITTKSLEEVIASSMAVSKIEHMKSLGFLNLREILISNFNCPGDTYIGPFEPVRILETDLMSMPGSVSGVKFGRLTTISFFPRHTITMADPNFPTFNELMRGVSRIQVRVEVLWEDPTRRNQPPAIINEKGKTFSFTKRFLLTTIVTNPQSIPSRD